MKKVFLGFTLVLFMAITVHATFSPVMISFSYSDAIEIYEMAGFEVDNINDMMNNRYTISYIEEGERETVSVAENQVTISVLNCGTHKVNVIRGNGINFYGFKGFQKIENRYVVYFPLGQ